MSDEKIGRADFFRHVFQKTTSAALQLADNILEPLQQASETAERLLSSPLIPVDDYTGEPKPLTSSTPPLFILGEKDEDLIAVPAVCAMDGFMLSYLPQEGVLYCSACKRKYSVGRSDGRITIDLPVYPLAVKEGYIHLTKLK